MLEGATIDLLVHYGEVNSRGRDKAENEQLKARCDPETCEVAWGFSLPVMML